MNGLPYLEVDDEICEGCLLGKQHRESFWNKDLKANDCLALVHSDLCCPTKILSFGKAWYFLTFFDDYSRKNLDIFFAGKSKSLWIFCLVQGDGWKAKWLEDSHS